MNLFFVGLFMTKMKEKTARNRINFVFTLLHFRKIIFRRFAHKSDGDGGQRLLCFRSLEISLRRWIEKRFHVDSILKHKNDFRIIPLMIQIDASNHALNAQIMLTRIPLWMMQHMVIRLYLRSQKFSHKISIYTDFLSQSPSTSIDMQHEFFPHRATFPYLASVRVQNRSIIVGELEMALLAALLWMKNVSI